MTTGTQANYAARVRAAGAGYVPVNAFNDRDLNLVFTFAGVDMTAATFRGQVRARPDAAGDPLASFSWGTPALVDGDTVVTATLAKADISDLPSAPEPGTAALLYADFTIEPDGGVEQTFQAGEFYRVGSVTQ